MTYKAEEGRYANMPYYRSGKSGLKLPAISLGLWHNFGGVDRYENGRTMIRRAFDLGITHFDLANNYGPPAGSAEETFGRIWKEDLQSYRDEIIVSTKAGYLMWPGPYGEWGSKKHGGLGFDRQTRESALYRALQLLARTNDRSGTYLECLGHSLPHSSGEILYAGTASRRWIA
jgi:L-glyceraldehyde 3-phosphate reductase